MTFQFQCSLGGCLNRGVQGGADPERLSFIRKGAGARPARQRG